ASAALPLNVGPNAVTVMVKAQDGTSVNSYTVNITRAPSSDDALSQLAVSAGAFTPVFDKATFTYSLSVPNSVTSTTVTAVRDDATAFMSVGGTALADGVASAALPL